MPENKDKPLIETIINTAAIVCSSLGVIKINSGVVWLGMVLILFACGLEFFKYWARKNNYW